MSILKVWNSDRSVRKTILLRNGSDFLTEVRKKFDVASTNLRFVFEMDGTEMDDLDMEALKAVAADKLILTVLVGEEQWTHPDATGVLKDLSNTPTAVSSSHTPTTSSLASPADKMPTTPVTPSTSRASDDGNVFATKESLMLYLKEHPNTKLHMECLANGGAVTVKQRQDISRITIHKLIATHGNYPPKETRRKLAGLLGDILGLATHVFYDEVTHDGFIVRGLENARRRLAPSEKVFTWTKRPKTVIAAESTVNSSGDNEDSSSASPAGCPRNVVECSLCGGLSNEESVEKLKNLSSSHTSELHQCVRLTHCLRQSWILNQHPTISSLLDAYPKFCMVPELIDLEFGLKYPDSGDLMSAFMSQLVDPLLKYAILAGSSIKAIAEASHGKSTDYRVYAACKVATMLLKSSGRRRISGVEAFERIMVLVPQEKSLSEIPAQAYFRLLIHGNVENIISIKISAESQMLEAGSSLLEALDRLFKLFWIFGIEYTPGTESFYRILNSAIYKLEHGSVPKSVTELIAVLQKHR